MPLLIHLHQSSQFYHHRPRMFTHELSLQGDLNVEEVALQAGELVQEEEEEREEQK